MTFRDEASAEICTVIKQSMTTVKLKQKKDIILHPKSPYNFNANFHKPSHFPSSDNTWEKDKALITMVWKSQHLGLKFENIGTIGKPKINLRIYSKVKLEEEFIRELTNEIEWRFNFGQDISKFSFRFKNDRFLGPVLKKWRGMKPIAANSLYETLMIYLVLQNATVRRSVQMLENLFNRFGEKVEFDNKVLSAFWEPEILAQASEEELKNLKVGYRAKFFIRISQKFANKLINEFELRKMEKWKIKKELLTLYGIGPASLEYLLFEDFYFLDALEKIPPWEQKIISRLLFNKKLVPEKKILKFFKEKYKGYEKLAFHYIWEDVFWKRKNEHIDWLEREIRL